MFCSQCGYRLDEDDKFCPQCGALIKPERVSDLSEYDADTAYDDTYYFEDSVGSENMSQDIYEDNTDEYGDDIQEDMPEYEKKPDNRQRQRREEAKKKQRTVIIACGIVAALAAIVIVMLVGFNFYKNYRMDKLKEAYTVYEQLMDEYMIEDSQYKDLLVRAQKVIEGESVSDAKAIEDELKEAAKVLEATSESRKKLMDLKTEYTELLSKYRISGEYKEGYDTVMQSLEDAIASSDEKQLSTLKKQLESLKINLNTVNQQEVVNIKNEITSLNVFDADEADAKRLEQYKTQVEEALSGNDYATALDILEVWREDAKAVADKIEKENKAKAESIKKEQERLESESRAEESRREESEKEEALSGDYILPQSSTQLLTESDLSGLSANDLMLARNEIYARHGRKFIDTQIQAYFNSKSWYHGTVEAADFDVSVLSSIERTNISFISAHE